MAGDVSRGSAKMTPVRGGRQKSPDRRQIGTFFELFLGDVIVVVFHCAYDDVFGDLRAVDADELHSAGVLSRDVLVGAEVVDQTTDDVYRYLVDIGHGSVYGVALEHSYDLVICLIVVEKTEASDRAGVHDDVTMGHILLGEDTDIQRVAVTFHIEANESLVCELSHLRTAICPWKESIKRRNYIGEFLWPVK